MSTVVVVGGGPAGLIAAERLARAGVKTTLVERAPRRVRPCAGILTSALVKEFELPEHLLTHRIGELGVFSPTSRVAFLPLEQPADSAGVMDPALLMELLRRRAFDAGVQFVHGTFLRFLPGAGDYPALAVRPAGGGATLQLSADVVIAADGAGSRVARAIGEAPVELGVVYQERLTLPVGAGSPTAAQVHLGRKISADGFGWLLPMPDHLLVGAATGLRYGKRLHGMLNELKKRLGNQLDGTRPGGREAYFYARQPRERLAVGRVLFVGQAAGLSATACHDSLYYACKSGQLAAETVIKHRHMPLPEHLAEYDQAWSAQFGPLFAGLKRLETTFLRTDRRREALVELAWDEAVGRCAAESFLTKRPFAPPLPLRLKLKGRVLSQLIKSSMRSPRHLAGEQISRALPESDKNYVELALKSRTGPLRPAQRVVEPPQES